jgi:flagellar export protein FliJ
MRRFRFRLAPLLRVRAQLERTSRRELANALGALATVEQKLAAAANGLRECADQGARPDAVGQLAKQLESGLRRHQWRLQQQRQKANAQVEVARVEHAQRARETKALQTVRDQQREQWRVAASRAEQAELDELASLARAAAAATGATMGNDGKARGARR